MTFRDDNYQIIGHIEDNRIFRDGNYKIIGKIDDYGDVRDGNCKIIGYGKEMSKQNAAYYFFFKK